jgi:hypothetical protein
LFRRTKTETPAPAPVEETSPSATQKKGRPTPSRKEAEAAAKARAKVPRTRKEQSAARRAARTENAARVREGMRTGNDRDLLPRDKGPVKRFIRDYVDSRFLLLEALLPVMFVVVLLGWTGSRTLSAYLNMTMFVLLILVVLEGIRLRFRIRKELAARFPDAPLKGTTYYTILRAMQLRFMRQPKPQVKIGQQLPDTYR